MNTLARLTDDGTQKSCHTHLPRKDGFSPRHRSSPVENIFNSNSSSQSAAKPAWIVFAWPPVLWQPGCAPELQFVHLGTRVLHSGDPQNRCVGQTLWGEDSVSRSAGVAWDWVEIGEGVVAMADPFGMVTNLRLLGTDGAALSPGQIALHLHTLVYGLPWQNEVQRVLGKPC